MPIQPGLSFLVIRLAPGNLAMIVIDMRRKSPITGEWIYGIRQKHVYFNIIIHSIVDTASIIKIVFPRCLLFVI